jgi:hypothetical protein
MKTELELAYGTGTPLLTPQQLRLCAERNIDPAVFARKRAALASPKPPKRATNPHGLTAQQLRICAETNCDPAVFARLRAGGV